MNIINGVDSSARSAVISSAEEESKTNEQNNSSKHEKKGISPDQPLPGSSISIAELWRMVKEELKIAADALGGTSKENAAAKKSMIGVQKETQINDLKERETNLKEEKAAKAKQGIWSKVAMAFGVLAAVIMAPFNPVMAAVMIGFLIAGAVVPLVADKVLEAAGVPAETRSYVKMALELTIGVVGMIVSFNPGNIASAAGSAIAKGAAAATKFLDKSLDISNTVKSFINGSSTLSKMATKVSTMADDLILRVKDLTSSTKLATTISQAGAVAEGVASSVSTGYGIARSFTQASLEKTLAKTEELDSIVEQVLIMLESAMRSFQKALESLTGFSESERNFIDKSIAITGRGI